jgi:hypothetical protein
VTWSPPDAEITGLYLQTGGLKLVIHAVAEAAGDHARQFTRFAHE